MALVSRDHVKIQAHNLHQVYLLALGNSADVPNISADVTKETPPPKFIFHFHLQNAYFKADFEVDKVDLI